MNELEELHCIIDLINKYNLPLSPILEYAINERKEQYQKTNTINNDITMKCEIQPVNSPQKMIEDYCEEFSHLSVGSVCGQKLPHKAILLISIMNLIETDVIEENKIPLDKTISNAFISTWKKYFYELKVPSVWTPFYHLKSESFWHFKAAETEDKLQMLLSFGGTPSIGKMRPIIKFAYFDDALFSAMKNAMNRNLFVEILINNYVKSVCYIEK